jgi:hypothetical protein
LNKFLLHLEGFAIIAISLYFYKELHLSWFWFFILLFLPDMSMIGYAFNNRVGAALYNFFHTYTLAIIIIIFGVLLSHQWIMAIGLILSAHIGMDRMLGFGLKYATDFKDNHLNRV